MQKANVIKLNNGTTYIAGLGIVNVPKRLYWISNNKRQGWQVDPLGGKGRCFFPVYGNDDLAMKYKKAVRELSDCDRPLRDARIIQTREYGNKVRFTGMAGVRVREVRSMSRLYTYVEVSGAGILDDRRWVVEGGSTFSKLSLLETAKDYRRGVVDLWYEEHEMTVEDCITPVIDEDNFRKLPA